jgi:hypothetical protein
MPATVASATAMEPAASMKSAACTAAERARAATEAAANRSASGEPAASETASSDKAAPAEPRPSVETTSIESAAVVAMTVVPVEPGTGADEDSADEPIRAVVSIGRTSIRVIIIVAVRAYRRRSNITISRPESYADSHSLRVSERSGKHANAE